MAITVTPGASNSDGGDLDLEPDGPTAKTSLGHGYVRFSVPIPAHLLPAFHVAELAGSSAQGAALARRSPI